MNPKNGTTNTKTIMLQWSHLKHIFNDDTSTWSNRNVEPQMTIDQTAKATSRYDRTTNGNAFADSAQGSRQNHWPSCFGSALQKQTQKPARIWWSFCRSVKSEMSFQHSLSWKAHTHTPALKEPMDIFQNSSQLLMWWPFTEASQAIHRRDKFGTCNWHLLQPTHPIYPIVFYYAHKHIIFLP
jgi:hypothetical protein